jgi:hypothetical protein
MPDRSEVGQRTWSSGSLVLLYGMREFKSVGHLSDNPQSGQDLTDLVKKYARISPGFPPTPPGKPRKTPGFKRSGKTDIIAPIAKMSG